MTVEPYASAGGCSGSSTTAVAPWQASIDRMAATSAQLAIRTNLGRFIPLGKGKGQPTCTGSSRVAPDSRPGRLLRSRT